jgi:hypothetical protein
MKNIEFSTFSPLNQADDNNIADFDLFDKNKKEEVILFNDSPNDIEMESPIEENPHRIPNMWSLNYIGLYCQYAIVGLLYGSSGTVLPFCIYVYDGPSNLCSNAASIITFPWSLKIFYALLTDLYHPEFYNIKGRRAWMILGMSGTLICLLFLSLFAEKMVKKHFFSSFKTLSPPYLMFFSP